MYWKTSWPWRRSLSASLRSSHTACWHKPFSPSSSQRYSSLMRASSSVFRTRRFLHGPGPPTVPLSSWASLALLVPTICIVCSRRRGIVSPIGCARITALLCFAPGLRCGQAPHPALQAHPLQHVVGWGVRTLCVGVKVSVGCTPPWGQVATEASGHDYRTIHTQRGVPPTVGPPFLH